AEGMAARLVAEVPGAIDQFEFTHALIQETLRTEVPTSVRVRLHRRIADAIVKLGGGREGADVGALAFHYSEAASSGCVDEAVAYAQRAAEQSMQSLAFEDALLYLERGLTVASLRDEPDPAERAALQLASANAYYALRDEDRARQAALMAIDAAREARPPAAAEFGAAANLVWQLGTYGPPVEYELGRALVEEALEVVGDELVSTRIQLLDVLAANGGRAFPALVAYSTEAVALARATSDPRLLADALSAQAFVHGGPDSVEECRGIVNEVAALALDDPRGPLLNFEFRFMVRTRSALRDGHIMEFRAIIEEVRALSRRSAHPDARYLPRLWDGLRLRLEGAWSEAEARAQDAVDSLSGFDQTFALTHQFVQLVPIRAAQGRLDELEPLQAAFTGMNPILEYQCMLANTHACLGRTPEAHDRIAEIVDRHLDGIDRHSELWFAATSQLADACVMVGDEPRAQVLYDRMADVTDIIIVNSPSGCDGSFDRVLGRLAGLIGRWDDADTHFATGRALEERLQSPPLVARTDLHQAEMLLRARRPGDAARAEQLLSAAHATAVRLDMHDLLHDIETLRDQ
ncbi:MAG TPA: hypothetical protein VK461_01095, partial [Acidimicrobiales bacterium]|nr:hypothetical protein [Acidimicrobiales bacterium]